VSPNITTSCCCTVHNTRHEMIPARNATDAHEQDFVANRRVAYYSSCKRSHTALTHYTLLERVDVFSLRTAAKLSVAPTNSSPVAPPTASSPPRSARHAQHPAEIISWFVICIYHIEFSMWHITAEGLGSQV
jgi:hypothetical protein